MSHGPASDWGADRASKFKTRVGIWMFLLYAVVYVGFILVNTFNPRLMGSDIGSLNLAIVYGFGLIIFALMLAFVYNAICSAAEEELNGPALASDDPDAASADEDQAVTGEPSAPEAGAPGAGSRIVSGAGAASSAKETR